MRRLILPISLLAATALPAAAAHATTYCVNKPACAAVPGNLTAPTLKGAIDAAAAHAGQDAIELGAGTFPYPGALPKVANTNDISAITGAGQGTTHVVEGAAGALEVDDPGAVVQDLTIDTIAGTSAGALVLQGAGSTARRVTVGGLGDDGEAIGLDGGAILDHVKVDVPKVGGGMTSAYVFGSGGATIGDSSFSAGYGIRVNTIGTATLRNVKTDAAIVPLSLDAGVLDADGLLVGATGTNGDLVVLGAGSNATATVRHATLVARAGTTAVHVTSYANGARASATLRDVAITGPGTAINRTSTNGGITSLDIAYSAYDPSKTNVVGLPGPTDVPAPADSAFANAAGGDYSLPAGSPLVDKGEPVLPAGAATTDLAGGPRVTGARTDIGAYEYAPPAPISAPSGNGAAEEGSTPGTGGGTTSPVPAPIADAGVAPKLLLSASAKQKLDRKGRFAVRAVCAAPLGCQGTLKLVSGKVVLGRVKVSLKNGAKATFHVTLTRAGRAFLNRHAKAVRVSVTASVHDARGTRLPARTAFSGRRH